jgi:hypothetical protein
VPVQIAHGSGWGGLDDQTISSLSAFSQAVAAHRPGTERLTFDLALVVINEHTDVSKAQRFVDLMRKIGIERFAMGSDWPGVYTPGQYAHLVERELPLKPEEWHAILAHRADYNAKLSASSELDKPSEILKTCAQYSAAGTSPEMNARPYAGELENSFSVIIEPAVKVFRK